MAQIDITACKPVKDKTHHKHRDTVTFNGTDAQYTLTWPDGSPFTGHMNPNDSFTTPKTLTVDPHANNDSTNNDNVYHYKLSGATCLNGGGGDVIIDP